MPHRAYTGNAILIKDGAWLGERCCILSGEKNITIGYKSIIGANSVLTKDVPDFCIVVGNPARVIKKYNFDMHKWVRV